MDFHAYVQELSADDRFTANFVAINLMLVGTVILSMIVRGLLTHGGSQLAKWTRLKWLDDIGKEAVKRARMLLFWLTLSATVLVILAGVVYHVAERDVRVDVLGWYQQLTMEELIGLGFRLAGLIGAVCAAWCAARLVQRLRPLGELRITALFDRPGIDVAVKRWFSLLEKFSIAALALLAVWVCGRLVGLGAAAGVAVGFVLRILAIVAVARLLTLAGGTITHSLHEVGDRKLPKKYHRYWERVTRLFPFGERCFEAAVYITAASMIVRQFQFIDAVADVGPRVVQCIGIFFCTRVIIELVQVLLNEGFGLYGDETKPLDQKARTLVPLVQSVCQYVLYFGSVIVMMGVLGIDTTPILAGSAIIGLAVGLGAQNLVSDLVSGFFILFENQYLVGDHVQVGEATGVIEAVGIRLTKIRDAQGKLYLIANGQIKNVVNFSKGYVNAVVDLRVPSTTDLDTVSRAMTEAGRQLRASRREVLADTDVQGLVEYTLSDMTIRAVTKVQPGTHLKMQNEFRRLLKHHLGQQGSVRRAAA